MNSGDARQRMHTGQLYLFTDELAQEQREALEKLYDYNLTRPSETERRQALLKEMFAEIGENCTIEPPFHANWAGKFAHFGHDVYVNFNLTMVDDTCIYVGNHVMIGPNVTLATPMHPLLPEERNVRQREDGKYSNLEYAKPITIENNCWLAANVTVCGGVTIGEGSVICAGSVVTRDIPPHSLAAGNPCRVIRELTDADRMK